MLTRKSFFAIFLLLIFSLPVNVFAVDEEELLEVFSQATSYSYYTLRYTGEFATFERDREIAGNKMVLYKNIRGFEWGCSEPECHGDFVEAIRQCSLSLLLAEMSLYMLRIGGGDQDTVEEAKEELDKADQSLVEAYIAWEEVKSAKEADETDETDEADEADETDDDDDNGSSSSSGCFIKSLTPGK